MTKIKYIAGVLLIITGLGITGYYCSGKALSWYHQYRLKQEFEKNRQENEVEETEEPISEEPPQVVITQWEPMRLYIPSIELDYIVLQGDVMKLKDLDKGPVHYGMSDLPSTEGGNMAIAGHRAGKWNFFLRLDELEKGNEIYLETQKYRFTYLVDDVFLVEPNAWWVIDSTEEPAITLTTCHPKNRKPTHRLIVRGYLAEVAEITGEAADEAAVDI